MKRLTLLLIFLIFEILSFSGLRTYAQEPDDKWVQWHRPVDNPVFTTSYGNNHDAVLFVDTTLEYFYHLIISGRRRPASQRPMTAYLWRTKEFSWSSHDWELVSGHYDIGGYYEYDDGVKVDGKYYIYEGGDVFTFEGSLEDADGNWEKEGTFPVDRIDDVGVFYEDGVFHLFGEYGDFPYGPDGTSLAHFISESGLGDWRLVDRKAVNANPGGGNQYGVGDPTIAKIDGNYYIYCDLESDGSPYKVVAWRSASLEEQFEYIGVAAKPRLEEVDDWDNYRVQDPDIAYIPELSRYVMVVNLRDEDGNPGGYFPNLQGFTRVVGFFYSDFKFDK